MSTRNPFTGGDAGPAPPERDGDSSAPGGSAPSSRGGPGRRIRADVDPEADLLCARLPLTDLGNAERWLARFGADFRFCPELGWFWWDSRRWKLLSEEKDAVPAELMQSMAMTVRAIRNEANLVAASGYPAPVMSDKEMRELESWAQAYGTSSRESYVRGLGVQPRLGVNIEDVARGEWPGKPHSDGETSPPEADPGDDDMPPGWNS